MLRRGTGIEAEDRRRGGSRLAYAWVHVRREVAGELLCAAHQHSVSWLVAGGYIDSERRSMADDSVAQTRCLREAAAAVPELVAARSSAVRISGGISNHLFLVSCAGCETRALVRLYGTAEPLCDRKSEEALVQLLSARGFGPLVLGVFPGGRVETFWQHRRPLIPAESLKTAPVDFAGMVARRLAELHNLRLRVPGRATAEEQLDRWLAAVPPGGPVDMSALREAIAGADDLRPVASCAAERAIEELLTDRTLCHLDLFAANLLYGSDSSQGDGPACDRDVQFIDYEYASDAMVGLDIANHLSGCTELIEGESVTFDTTLYPTSAQQMHFLAHYLAERGLSSLADTLVSEPRAAVFARQLLVAFASEAECRWVVWGLLQQQLSSVSFDFGDYALQRWACYETYKGWLSGDQTPARVYSETAPKASTTTAGVSCGN